MPESSFVSLVACKNNGEELLLLWRATYNKL